MSERSFMEMAISMAEHCEPTDPERVPKVGAVIVQDDNILGSGYRGEDIHAEKAALGRVSDKTRLPNATVYTTLEPCTPGVRSRPEESCTSLLRDAQVKRVVIGILDPNQGVCGKGVLELQRHGIEVELFPPDLALKIRLLNETFIRAQQTLGVRFLDPEPNAQLHTYKRAGWHTFTCECITPPGPDVFAFIHSGDQWWPQLAGWRQVAESDRYHFDCRFGSIGFHEIHAVRANELGMGLINYYRKVTNLTAQQREKLNAIGLSEERINPIRLWYPGFNFTKLPRGLDSQANITIEVVAQPD